MKDAIEHFREIGSGETVNKKVEIFVSELKQYNFFNLAKKLVKSMYLASKDGERKKQENIRAALRYAQAIYAGMKFEPNERLITNKELKNLLKMAEEAMFSVSVHDVVGSVFSEKKEDLLFYAKQYEVCDGKTYPCFAHWIIANLMIPQDALLKEVYGITAEKFAEGLTALAVSMNSIGERIFSDPKGKTVIVDELLPDKIFSVKQITNWPDSLISDLTFNNGEAVQFFERERFKGWFNVEMPTTQRPFVVINGESCAFEHNICFDHIYRNLQKAICAKGEKQANQWKINQQEASEGFSAHLLNKPFQGAECFINNYYEEKKGHWIENDGILIYENVLIVFEVKAGAYTPRSVNLDPESHEKAIDSLIKKPINQCERLIKNLDEKKTLTICDQDHKEQIVLNRDKIDLILPFAIMVDPIGELATSYNTTIGFNNVFKETLPLSIFDLAIYSAFFDSPLFFLYYLKERIKSIDIEHFMNSDEMNYLGSYLSNRHFNFRYNNIQNEVDSQKSEEEIEANKLGSLFLDNLHEDIDNYFYHSMMIDRPKFNVSDFIFDTIRCLDKQQGSDRIKLTLQILDGTDELHEDIENAINGIVARQKITNRFTSYTVFYKDNDDFVPIQIFCNTSTHEFATETKAKEYSVAMIEARGYKKLFYLILKIDNGKVIEANCRLITIEQKSEIANPDYDHLVQHIKSTSIERGNQSIQTDIAQKLVSNQRKKIGRNELCPCGSGRKYKKCCGENGDNSFQNKEDAAMDEDILKKLADLVSKTKLRKTIKKCWHPLQNECRGKVKQAHALQNNRIINKIAVNGMVQTLEGRSNIFFQDSKERGRGVATTFFGFCDYHDTTVFREIEDRDYCGSDVQNFLFAYRAFIWHRHKKLENIESQMNFINSAIEMGITQKEAFSKLIQSFELGEKDGEFYQAVFDEMLITRNYSKLNSKVWELDYEVSFAITANFEVMFDLLGNQLYDTNVDRLPKFFLSIFPSSGKTFCIWSWLDCDDKYYKNYVDQFFSLSDENKKNYLNNNLTIHSDAILISPKLWDSFGEKIQESIISHTNCDILYLGMELEEGGKKFEYSETPWDFFMDLT